MNQSKESTFKLVLPTTLGIIFAVLQGFTVYFTRNVETGMNKLERKLNQTWETALVTKTEMATLKTEINVLKSDLKTYEAHLLRLREDFFKSQSHNK